MIAHLRGTLLAKHPPLVVVDVQGVGYELTVPVSTFAALPGEGEVKLHVYTAVREDAIQLFGFGTPEEKHLFEKLITVNGVGPKLAVTALSGLAPDELVAAIRAGDITKLTRIPGVGKKTAERIALELKDKLDLLPAASTAVPAKADVWSAVELDVISALMNLGSARPAAEEAMRKARGTADSFEPLFRRALELAR